MRSLIRGAAAGAVGTTVLNTITYLDMAITGRPASSTPVDVVESVADLIGVDAPGGNNDEALGALSGIGTGLALGAVASLVRSTGIRLPLLAEAAVIGAGAMAATDGPMAVLGVTDLSTWSSIDWARDVVPHLAYGTAVAASLRALEPDDKQTTPGSTEAERKPGRVLLRSLAIGVATGARSSLGLVPPALAAGTASSVISAGLVGTELVFDKLPQTPSRIGGPTVARVVAAGVGSAVLARREGATAVLPAVAAGTLGALAGTIGGSIWREFCAERGWTWQGAVAEDAVSIGLTALAVRSG